MSYVFAESVVGANRELFNRLRVTVIDLPLHLKATAATRARMKVAESARTQQEIERATGRQTPKL